VSVHILKDGDHWAKGDDGVADIGPEVSLIVGAFPLSSVGERLAGIAAGQDVDEGDGRPVHGGDIADVGHTEVASGQHRAGVLVDLGIPDHVAAVDLLHGKIKASIP